MSSIEILIQEVDFHPSSYCDSRGRVFWWKGELYRGIVKEYTSFYRKLFDAGIVQRLVEKQFLIETQLTDYKLKNYPLVLKHRCLPFVSYANEWCSEMLRDAALLIADLTIELASVRLRLPDSDTRNILFDGCRPVLVDFCSIVSNDNWGDRNWRNFKNNFYSDFVYPLRLMAQGYGNFARWLLTPIEGNVMQKEFAELMGYRNSRSSALHLSNRLKLIAERSLSHPIHLAATMVSNEIKTVLSRLGSRGRLSGVDISLKLRKELESIPMPSKCTKVFENDKDINPSLTPFSQWTEKNHTVHNILLDLTPNTVLDIGSNRGWYSQLAAMTGSKVVAVDRDEKKIIKLYRTAAKKDLPILPLVMDIRIPTSGFGMCNRELTPALQRLQCDLVLALSLVHVLVFDHHHTFEQISEMFAALSKKWLLVEFILSDDPVVRQKMLDRHFWYTLDNFIDRLKKSFRSISVMPSHPSPRVLLLCKK